MVRVYPNIITILKTIKSYRVYMLLKLLSLFLTPREVLLKHFPHVDMVYLLWQLLLESDSYLLQDNKLTDFILFLKFRKKCVIRYVMILFWMFSFSPGHSSKRRLTSWFAAAGACISWILVSCCALFPFWGWDCISCRVCFRVSGL